MPPLRPDIANGGHSILLMSKPPKDHNAPAKTNNDIALLLFINKSKINKL